MGNRDWWEEEPAPAWHLAPPPPTAPPPTTATTMPDRTPARPRRRTWHLVAAAALAIALAGVWNSAAERQRQQELKEKAAAYKGVSATNLSVDGVSIQTGAKWNDNGRSAVLSVWVNPREKPSLVRIESGDRTAQEAPRPNEPGIPMPITLEVTVPVQDHYQPVRMKVTARGPLRSHQARHRTIEFHSDRTAFDAKTGAKLKQYYSRLL